MVHRHQGQRSAAVAKIKQGIEIAQIESDNSDRLWLSKLCRLFMQRDNMGKIMGRVRFATGVAAIVVIAIGFGGCSSSNPTGGSTSNRDDLAALGVAYHAHHDMKGQGPGSVEDLINMLTDAAKRQEFSSSTACEKLKSGEFVLNPRIQFREAKNLENIAIIYEKKAPVDGGIVVLGDATTKELTAAQFKQLDSGDDARAKK